ncbi:MAG: 2-C-methyl-D-erythritol 4-phosphate cytidylyltransferase [Ignavibacteriales bacterium]|nr:2-C-methyl-D-erythritol 4-phosphate cytidylyltransferase [Ignavibacteriales bacterium]MCF8314820.1 2-C-methyl-D-erythritol 4-phosphate cytidylyltransferase [Ignavibacteriales bacterium]MCF8436231.1 2-C-methyl-D-erythritol 4-phosphate cytidylyltransferase [Ignavibacteriales bacterium]
MKCFAIIPAGGSGKRFGGNIPKQFIEVSGREIIAYTLEVFNNNDIIDEIIIPVSAEFHKKMEEIVKREGFTKITRIVDAGKERCDSVFNGFTAIRSEENDLIVIHDAARPLLTTQILNNAIASAKIYNAVTVAVPVKDSILSGIEKVQKYVSRENLYHIQTPQIFLAKYLADAYEKGYKKDILPTDESIMVHNASYDVYICNGSSQNFKITTQEDLFIFEAILNHQKSLF